MVTEGQFCLQSQSSRLEAVRTVTMALALQHALRVCSSAPWPFTGVLICTFNIKAFVFHSIEGADRLIRPCGLLLVCRLPVPPHPALPPTPHTQHTKAEHHARRTPHTYSYIPPFPV